MSGLRIGVCGAGVGGLCAAIALRQSGQQVHIFERAAEFDRVGADVNLTPNAVKALDKLGVGPTLRKIAARPEFRISRDGISGEETSRLPMSNAAEKNYGAPQLTIHRADLLAALQQQLTGDPVHHGMTVDSIDLQEQGASIVFSSGQREHFDLVLGADGIHSAVRNALWGQDDAKFTGIVSYRSVLNRDEVPADIDAGSFTKWWGEAGEKQIVTFPLTQGREFFVFATTPQQGWTDEGWTLPGEVEELRALYENFHPQARALLAACRNVTKSALHVREPMNKWSKGHVTILGDAAHPMMPFMAQGAAMAIEDAVVLARALDGVDSVHVIAALARYEAARKPRTAEVQRNSLANNWLKKGGNADWVYGYDAWSAELS